MAIIAPAEAGATIVLVAALLSCVKSEVVCSTERPHASAVMNASCDDEPTAVVVIDVQQPTTNTEIKMYVNDSKNTLIWSRNITTGFHVLSLPKPFLINHTSSLISTSKNQYDDVIPLFVELQSPGSSCRPDIILDPRLGAVEVDYPEAFLANEVNTISASVNEGMGVTFAFAINRLVNNSQQLERISIVKPCDMLTAQATIDFIPTAIAQYVVNVTAFMGGLYEERGFEIQSGCAIPPIELRFGPNCTDRGGPLYPGDQINIVIANDYLKNRPLSPNCTVDWGDNTFLEEEDVDLLPDPVTNIMYSRSHGYTRPGTFTVAIKCSNIFGKVNDTMVVRIDSPTDHAEASLFQSLVMLSAATQDAKVIVILTHQFITEDYPHLEININFGLLNSNRSFSFKNPPQLIEQMYTWKGDYTISVTFTAFGVSRHVILALRVGAIDIYIKNRPLTVRVNEQQMFTVVRFTSQGAWDVELNFGLENKTQTFSDGIDVISIPYTFSIASMMRITASVTVNSTVEVAVFEFNTFSGCIGTDLFEVSYRNEMTPLTVLMSEMPTISGRVQWSALCKNSKQLLFEWKLSVNRELAPVYDWAPVSIIQPFAINLVLKLFIDKPGLYQMKLSVKTVEENETVSDLMYIQVIHPPIVTAILGGSFRQHSVGKPLIVNAENVSYDPMAVSPQQSSLTYSWHCYMLTSEEDIPKIMESYKESPTYKHMPPCTLPELMNQGRISISTSNFTDGELLLFEVTAQKNKLESRAVQVVQMAKKQIPVINIECVWNCGTKLVTSERTVFTTRIECPECSSHDVYYAKYKWSLFKFEANTGNNSEVPSTIWDQKISSDPSSKSFDCEGGWWEEKTMYTLTVVVEVSSFPSVTTSHVLFTNQEASFGTCKVQPQEGIAADTEFIFSYTRWDNATMDASAVLHCAIYQRAAFPTPAIYSGEEMSTPKAILTACGTPSGYCDVEISVITPFQDRFTCGITVKVTDATRLSSNASIKEQLQTVLEDIEKINEKMSFTADLGDPVKIAQDSATYATVLISLNQAIGVSTQLPEPEFFNAANITSKDFLQFLLDPRALVQPAKEALSMGIQQHIENISHALKLAEDRDNLDNLGHLNIFTNALITATTDEELLKGLSLCGASAFAAKVSGLVAHMAENTDTLGKLEDSLKAIVQLLDNVIGAGAVNIQSLDPDTSILRDSGLSKIEIRYFSSLLANRKSHDTTIIIENAYQIAANVMDSWENLFSVWRPMEHFNGTFETKAQTFSAVVQKATRNDILNQSMHGGGSLLVNSFSVDDVKVEDNFTSLHYQVVRSENILTHGTHSKFITSDVFFASVASDNGDKLKMTAPRIVHDVGVTDCVQGDSLRLISPNFTEEDAAYLFYHSFNYLEIGSLVCITIRPSSSVVFYRLYMKMGSEPSDINYDYRTTISHEVLQNCQETCLPSEKLNRIGTVFIGLRPLIQDHRRSKRQAITSPLLSSYLFQVTTVACYSWEAKEVDWVASQCKISRGNGTITCKCSDGPQLINALSFSFAPNTIHFPTVFSRFDIKAQGTVLGVLLAIYFIFALIAIWAHFKDRRGIFQWGVFSLADNYADENYFYLITVHTGLRKSAGTKSKVSFCLSGELHETGVRKLSDEVREGFPTASVLHFVMACPASLGALQCLRIWHDNSGKGSEASWYLSHLDVTDIQTGHTYYFVCDDWLTPENNTSDKIIEASSIKELQSLKTIFFFQTKKRITDDHIWLSILIRPERSRFSRLERTGCCLAFVLLAMITSTMFYKWTPGTDRQQPPSDLQIGPLRLSIQQMYYSFISTVITAVPVTALVVMFRRARTLSDEDGQFCCNRGEKDQKNSSGQKVSKFSDLCSMKLPCVAKLERQLAELEKILLIKADVEEMKKTWPRFWRHMAWVIVFFTVIICSFFVVLYTMEWGKDVTETWLSTFFIAFLESMFVVDPFKVVLISILLSVLMRKAKVKSVDELSHEHISQINKEHGIRNKPSPSRQSVSFLPAFSEKELRAATHKRKIHIMIRNTLQELAIHCVILIITTSICYSNRSPHDNRLYNIIYADLVDQSNTGFNSINSSFDYFAWLENVLVPWLFPEKDSKGHSIVSEDRLYTVVWDLYRLGAPRLRQLRMRKGDCLWPRIDAKPCIDKYSILKEETREFCLGWSNTPCPQSDRLHVTAGAWGHRSALSTFQLPITGEYNTYGGGGYIVNLDINLILAQAIVQEMKQYLWIDRQTRAVILEFTVYCPNVNRFVYVTLLAEFPETGGVVPFVNIYPFMVYDPPGALGTYITICEVLYLCFTAFGFFFVIFVLSQEKWAALKNFWFIVDVAAVAVATTTISMFFLRMKSVKAAISRMKEDRTQFLNFQHVAMWDTGFIICLAFLVAIACFRLLKLAGYSERTIRVYYVLKLAVGTLPSFFSYICLIIMSFTFLGYQLFNHTSPYFKSFLDSMMTLFTGLLGHSGFKETNLPESDQWETVLFFCLFVVICVLFLTNLFLAVLLDILTVEAQRNCPAVKSDEAQIFILLLDSFFRLFGKKKCSEVYVQEEAPQNSVHPESQVNMNQDDWYERILNIGRRTLDVQDEVAMLHRISFHEPEKHGGAPTKM